MNVWMVTCYHLSLADDTALVADSEEKLCRLMSEYVRVFERRKCRLNICKSKVTSCTRYVSMGRMDVRLRGLLKLPGSQVAAGRGCEMDVVHRINEGCKGWRALKSVLSNRGMGNNAKKCL